MPGNFRSDCFGSYDSHPEEVSYLKHPFIPTSNALIMSLLPCDNVPRFMARKRPLLPFEVAAGDWDCVTVSRSKVWGIFGAFGPGDSGLTVQEKRRFSKKFQQFFTGWSPKNREVLVDGSTSGVDDRDPGMIPLFEHHMATHPVRDIHRLSNRKWRFSRSKFATHFFGEAAVPGSLVSRL